MVLRRDDLTPLLAVVMSVSLVSCTTLTSATCNFERLAVVQPTTTNIGDDIQVVAMLRIVKAFQSPLWSFDPPQLGTFMETLSQAVPSSPFHCPLTLTILHRDNLSLYTSECLVLAFGWMSKSPAHRWMPGPSLRAVFIATSLDLRFRKSLLKNRKALDVFKQSAPIGCRDISTMSFLVKLGIPAYFSGCLTLTLGNWKQDYSQWFDLCTSSGVRGDDNQNCLVALNNQNTWRELGSNHTSFLQRLQLARGILDLYASANRVYTGRLHTYLPCRAMGKKSTFTGDKTNFRFSGLLAVAEDGHQIAKMSSFLLANLTARVQLELVGKA